MNTIMDTEIPANFNAKRRNQAEKRNENVQRGRPAQV